MPRLPGNVPHAPTAGIGVGVTIDQVGHTAMRVAADPAAARIQMPFLLNGSLAAQVVPPLGVAISFSGARQFTNHHCSTGGQISQRTAPFSISAAAHSGSGTSLASV
jgi:hypothetical protein